MIIELNEKQAFIKQKN